MNFIKSLLNRVYRALAIKEKIEKLDFIKIKNLSLSKFTSKRVWQAVEQ